MLKFHDGMLLSDYIHAIEFQAQGGVVSLMDWVISDGGIVDDMRFEDQKQKLMAIG